MVLCLKHVDVTDSVRERLKHVDVTDSVRERLKHVDVTDSVRERLLLFFLSFHCVNDLGR
jgi:hypothetical protein